MRGLKTNLISAHEDLLARQLSWGTTLYNLSHTSIAKLVYSHFRCYLAPQNPQFTNNFE